MAGSLSDRLGLHDKVLKPADKGIKTEEVVNTGVIEPFPINPFVNESLNVGTDNNSVQALQETYPHLAVIDPVT